MKLPKIRKHDQDPALPFTWRDRDGNHHLPATMLTRHLFFTIRMIWNHNCPTSLQLHPYEGYTFKMYYSKKYMAQGLHNLIPELSTRDDMTPYMNQQLLKMLEWSGAMKEHLKKEKYLDNPKRQIAKD